MKKIFFMIFAMILLLVSCEENENVQFDGVNGQTLAYFISNTASLPIEMDGSGTTEVSVEVTTVSSQDRTIQIAIVDDETNADASMYTAPTSLTIPANEYVGIFNVNADWDDILATEDKTVTFELTSVENGIVSNEKVAVRIYEGCNPNNLLILTLNFDGFANETSWDLVDSSNTVVFSAALGTYFQGQSSASAEICIEDGDYTFTIYDSWGDGLFDGTTTGNWELVNDLDGTVYVSGSGNFGSSDSTSFTK